MIIKNLFYKLFTTIFDTKNKAKEICCETKLGAAALPQYQVWAKVALTTCITLWIKSDLLAVNILSRAKVMQRI